MRTIVRINRWLHAVAGVALLAIVLVTVANIIGRRFLEAPLPGSIELTEMGMILVIFLGFAYAEQHGDHITIDLVYARLGSRGRMALDLLKHLAALVLLALLVRYVNAYASRLAATGETTGVLGMPVLPFAYVALVGLIAFAGAIVTNIIALFDKTEQGDGQ